MEIIKRVAYFVDIVLVEVKNVSTYKKKVHISIYFILFYLFFWITIIIIIIIIIILLFCFFFLDEHGVCFLRKKTAAT